MTNNDSLDAGTDLNDLMAGEWKPAPIEPPAELADGRPNLRESLQEFIGNIDNAIAVSSGYSDSYAKGFDEAARLMKEMLIRILEGNPAEQEIADDMARNEHD